MRKLLPAVIVVVALVLGINAVAEWWRIDTIPADSEARRRNLEFIRQQEGFSSIEETIRFLNREPDPEPTTQPEVLP